MYVTFPVSQREFLRAQQAGTKIDITGIKVTLLFADGSVVQAPRQDQLCRRLRRSRHRHGSGARHFSESRILR